ncbi:TrmB family transcriptional regulator [Halomicrococcus sp. NG-SE-24]|uniref:TrmB family transcriptional regulator n=1 Tax=Halomicrococcus sp. NG-SE-24 TaxID=3436928 RepID=UPI003D97FA88
MSDDSDAKAALLLETLQQNVGLSQYEASVYLALVRGGRQTMTELAESSDVPKQRVYDIIDKLQGEGFVEIVDEYPQKAYAVDPTEALTPIQRRLEQTETYLDELHETVDPVDSGVTLFKSRPTIEKYLRNSIQDADEDIFLLAPLTTMDKLTDSLQKQSTDVRIRLVISNIDSDHVVDDTIALEHSCTDLADDVHGMASSEPLILTTDRSTAVYWPTPDDGTTTGHQGFYLTNPELAFILDRFLSEMIWPLTRPVDGMDDRTAPTFPVRYSRIRDCLRDVKKAAKTRPLDSLEVEFDGYDTETGDAVTKQGMLVDYYLTDYDLTAYITVELDEARATSGQDTVTVGGWHARNEDYEARTITIRDRNGDSRQSLDNETRTHLDACHAQLPASFGDGRITAGFDAFIDRKREIVADRTATGDYEPVRQFSELIETLVEFEASERTPRLEWHRKTTAPGGHTAHVGTIFDNLGYDVSIIGRLGDPIAPEFEAQFTESDLLTVGSITATEYVEFDDRRLLLTEPNWNPLEWDTIVSQVGVETLANYIDNREILTVGSWSSTPSLPSIWDGFRTDLWPLLESPPRAVHFSPADIEWLSESVLKRGVDPLSTFDDIVPVTVTVSRSQTKHLLDVLDQQPNANSLVANASALQDELDISQCIVHTFDEAVLVGEDTTVSARAPRSANSTNLRIVEEYFDFGIALALLEDLSPGPALVLGHAIARYVTRHGEPPTGTDLHAFLDEYETHLPTSD